MATVAGIKIERTSRGVVKFVTIAKNGEYVEGDMNNFWNV